MSEPLATSAVPRLIASDLDGTLLNSSAELSARTVAAIRGVVERGIEFVPVTGRSRWSLLPIMAAAGDGPGWHEIRSLGLDEIKISTNPVIDAEPPTGPIVKIMVAHPEHTGHDWLGAIEALLPPGVAASTAGASFMEISAPAAEKGAVLAEFCQRRLIASDEVVAFGDHANDLGMLAWVGRGYVMANGHRSAMAVSELRAPHHDEDGVAQIIERWLD